MAEGLLMLASDLDNLRQPKAVWGQKARNGNLTWRLQVGLGFLSLKGIEDIVC